MLVNLRPVSVVEYFIKILITVIMGVFIPIVLSWIWNDVLLGPYIRFAYYNEWYACSVLRVFNNCHNILQLDMRIILPFWCLSICLFEVHWGL